MSSSSDYSDEELIDQPVAKKFKSKRNIFELEAAPGESNLKGFVNAFQTIMNRASVGGSCELLTAVTPVNEKPAAEKAKETEPEVTYHAREPVMVCERESTFKATAERGIVKLFRAVAMTRKRAIEHEASRGIGLTKSGQRRILRRPRAVAGGPATGPVVTPSKTGTMSSFLETLKSSKRASVKPITAE